MNPRQAADFRAALDPWAPLLKLAIVVVAIWLLRTPLGWLGSQVALLLGRLAQDVIRLKVFGHIGGVGYLRDNWGEIAGYFGDHVRYTAEAVAISVAIAVPVGILIQRVRSLYLPVFAILDLIYTIPSFVTYVFLLAITGLTDTTVIIGVVVYAQFILVRNVVVGLDGVPEDVRESARGMGMNPLQILLRVELPLAVPVIFAGLRVATVATVATVSIAALIAMPNLGYLFWNAVQNGGVNATQEIEAGAIMVTALALGADGLLRILEHFIPANRVARAGRANRLRTLASSIFLSRSSAQDPLAIEADG